MTTTLLDRLTAAIDEDERIAREAGGVPWTDDVTAMVHVDPAVIRDNKLAYGHLGFVASADRSLMGDAYRRHIARQNPKATLLRCAAERKLLAAVLQWEHEYNDDNPYTSCAQAIAHGDPDAQTPGDGCADEGRAGGPCDCATGRRRDLILSSLAAAYDLTVEED